MSVARSAAPVILAAAAALPAQGPLPGLRDLPLPRQGRAIQFDSHDPSGANVDHGHFHGTTDGWQILADAAGPGRVTRLWSANPAGTLAVDIDGTTVWQGPIGELLTGRLDGIRAPLVGDGTGGGWISYAPIPFRESLRLRLRADDPAALYYQVGLHLRPVDASWAPDAADDATAAALLDPGFAFEHLRVAHRADVAPADGSTDTPIEITRLTGAGEVCELRVTPADGTWPHALRRGVWLEFRVDGEERPRIAAPLGDLFGVGFEGAGIDTLPVHAVGNARRFRLPMPYRDGLTIHAVRVDGTTPPPFDLSVGYRELGPDHGRGTLCARFHRQVNVREEPYPILDVQDAAGHLVGAFATMAGASGQWLTFLEGDETIRVDGATTPAIHGTGTEDDYGGAWYFRGGPFRAPFHAASVVDGARALVAVARFRIPDPVPFTTGIRWTTEHGGGNDAPGSDYATLAFWYQHGGAPPVHADAATRRRFAAQQAKPQPFTLPAAALFPELSNATGVATLAPGTALPDSRHRDWQALGDAPARVGLLRRGRTVTNLRRAADGRFGLTADADSVAFDTVRVEPWLPAIRTFRVTGPFVPSADRAGIHDVFWPERPDADRDGDAWRRVDLSDSWNGYLDLNSLFDGRDRCVAYAAVDVTSPRAQDAWLVLGSDDAVKVFVDGRELHRTVTLRGAGRDQDRVRIALREGTQTLLFKVEDYAGGFGLFARIDGAEDVRFDD